MASSGAFLMACLAVGSIAGFGIESAQAQGKLDARYVATLAGVPIGRGAWVIDIGEEQFSAAASGMASGLLRVFTTGQGSAASRGVVRGDNLLPTAFASTIVNDRRTEELRMVFSGGNVKEFSVSPTLPSSPNRIPLTEAHRHGVVDPMSAGLLRVPGTADPLSSEACRRNVAVFDGRMRFDLHLTFKRFETVHSERGYQGRAVVCAVQFVPLAGYVPDRAAIKYIVAQRDIEAWLAPIAGTRVMVPYRLVIPTPIGTGVLTAVEFNTAPIVARTSASAAAH
jgi:hypothetical protein